MKINFEIKDYQGEKVIQIDQDIFDWRLDDDALDQANEFASSNPNALNSIHQDIKNYFLECLEEFTGFKMTMKEVNQALKFGYIEK